MQLNDQIEVSGRTLLGLKIIFGVEYGHAHQAHSQWAREGLFGCIRAENVHRLEGHERLERKGKCGANQGQAGSSPRKYGERTRLVPEGGPRARQDEQRPQEGSDGIEAATRNSEWRSRLHAPIADRCEVYQQECHVWAWLIQADQGWCWLLLRSAVQSHRCKSGNLERGEDLRAYGPARTSWSHSRSWKRYGKHWSISCEKR